MILVTGATGLVGAHLLAKLLKTEKRVRALYRSKEKQVLTKTILSYYFGEKTPAVFEKIEWDQADITDVPALTKAFEGVTRVFHCAGKIDHDPKNFKTLRKINIEGTANVVNLCLSFKVKKLCYVSSIASLGKPLTRSKITENDFLEHDSTQSVYALTKFGGEMEVWRGSQEGLPVIIVNPGVIIGPGNWGAGSGLLFSKIYKGLRFSFSKTTGFVAVEDVSNAMIALMEKNVQNERYILVSENCTFEKVISKVAQALGKPAPKRKLKPWMVACGWFFQCVGSVFFNTKRQLTRSDIRGLFKSSVYDNTKIKAEIGIYFIPVSEAIEKNGPLFLRSL